MSVGFQIHLPLRVHPYTPHVNLVWRGTVVQTDEDLHSTVFAPLTREVPLFFHGTDPVRCTALLSTKSDLTRSELDKDRLGQRGRRAP